MIYILHLLQLIVAISVIYIWIFRHVVVKRDFQQFQLSDLTMAFVGASKVSIATLLIVGIWFHALILIPAICMGLFMVAAQYFHFKIKNPIIQRLPSLCFLALCIGIAVMAMVLDLK